MEALNNLIKKCKEMVSSSHSEMKALGKEMQKEVNMIKNLHIKELHQLQSQFPDVIIAGSAALFLHGIKLKRWQKAYSDIDIIIPYYINLSMFSGRSFSYERDITILDVIKNPGYGSSPNGFDYTGKLALTKEKSYITPIDIKIDNKTEYEIVDYQEEKFKVSKLEDIIKAKIEFGVGNQKHIKDLYEMTGKLIPPDEVEAKRDMNGS